MDSRIYRIGGKHPSRAGQRVAVNVLTELSRAYWALQPDFLAKMVEVLSRANLDLASLRAEGQLQPAAIERETGDPLEGTSFVTIIDGIATVRVAGPMMRYGNAFAEMCSGPSATYERLAHDYGVLLESPKVRGTLWDLDTPGGEVNGCSEFAAMAYKYRDAKPNAVIASGQMCSAGMWIGSALSKRLAVGNTAMVGSIGVCATFTDVSGFEEQMGIKTIEIVSSQSPRKRVDIKTDEGQKEIKSILDALAAVFINSTATYRGVTPEVVLRDFGQGGVFIGEDAVAAGLADEVSTYEDVHAELRDRVATGSRASVIVADRAPTPAPGADMKTTQPVGTGSAPAALPVTQPDPSANAAGGEGAAPAADDSASVCPECGATMEGDTCPNCAYTRPAPDASVATPPAAQPTDAQRENARVRGILELARPGEQALVQACIADVNCSVEAAALRLRQAERNPGAQYLSTLRRDEEETPAPANVRSSATANTVESVSDMIANAGKPATQRPAR